VVAFSMSEPQTYDIESSDKVWSIIVERTLDYLAKPEEHLNALVLTNLPKGLELSVTHMGRIHNVLKNDFEKLKDQQLLSDFEKREWEMAIKYTRDGVDELLRAFMAWDGKRAEQTLEAITAIAIREQTEISAIRGMMNKEGWSDKLFGWAKRK